MAKIKIEINNHKCKLIGERKKLIKVQKAFQMKHPNAYWLRIKGYVESNWDGKIKYITDAFYFKTGLLPQVVKHIKETGDKVKFIDLRKDFGVKPKVPKEIAGYSLTGDRQYQGDAISAIVHNKIGKLNFPIGVENAATNAGKTMIMAGIYLAYKRKIPALVLLKDGDLFEQFKKELPELLGDDVGFVRGKEKNWKNFTVAMVQTLSRDVRQYRNNLSKFGIILVDEADEGNSKSYQKILQNCYNAPVRVGLSGSIYLSKLKKDETKNQNLKCYFGDEVFKITNKEMVEKGHSTNIVIRIFKGNEKIGERGDWKKEYDLGITYNEDRASICIDRMKANIKRKRLPALVVCKFHNHILLMYQMFQQALGNKYRIEYVHGDVKNRKELITEFREGKIDILIASFIIKRGKNFPLLRYLLNAAGSDSHSTVLQLMGRLFRKSDKKRKVYMEDLFDEGIYLKRHSKHRVTYYKKEKFKVIEKYKK